MSSIGRARENPNKVIEGKRERENMSIFFFYN
jgi:hypothetical protein